LVAIGGVGYLSALKQIKANAASFDGFPNQLPLVVTMKEDF
jgi:hypothetical protein